MPRINWPQLKLEYLKSEHHSVQKFLKAKGMKYNGNTAQKTKGWSTDKKNISAKRDEKVMALVEAKTCKDADSVANEIVAVITKQKKVGDDLLERIQKVVEENVELYFDALGNAHEGPLSARSLASLTKAAKDAVEIQRVTYGITGQQQPGESSQRIIDARVLAVIRKVRGKRTEDITPSEIPS